jgi:hypothetical protein
MILDPECFTMLREAIRPDTAVTNGWLRDPLIGQIVGVKLFRSACFEQARVPDSISQDVDFVKALRKLGWKSEYLKVPNSAPDAAPPTVGEHRPDYTPGYTFRKFLIEGQRYRYRGARGGLRWYLGRLEESSHELALFAQIALAHGFFQPGQRDELKPRPEDPRAADLVALLASDGQCEPELTNRLVLDPRTRLSEVFRCGVRTGQSLARARAGATARELFSALSGVERDWRIPIARLGLGHGLLSPDDGATRLPASERTLEVFLSLGRHGMRDDPSLPYRLWARFKRMAFGLRLSGQRLHW